MIVLDNSALVAAIVGTDRLSAAVRSRLAGERLLAPELIDVEFVNALRGLVGGGTLSVVMADRAVRAMRAFPLERVSHRPLLDRAWALQNNLSAYDATYVALAELLGVALVTGDRRIAGAPGLSCVVEVIG